jgi:hypothetical protein
MSQTLKRLQRTYVSLRNELDKFQQRDLSECPQPIQEVYGRLVVVECVLADCMDQQQGRQLEYPVIPPEEAIQQVQDAVEAAERVEDQYHKQPATDSKG